MTAQGLSGAATSQQNFKGRSLLQDALRRFCRNKAAMGGVGMLVLLAALSIIVPMVSPHGIEDIHWDSLLIPPSLESGFIFGTDVNGRDLFVRCFYAGRISLTIGVLTTSVALVIGIIFGSVAGFFGGHLDNVMMRFVDVLYALPTLFLIIVLITILRADNVFFVFMCIGALQWLTMARIVRGQTLSVKRTDYVRSAHAIGLGTSKILSRYIVPNVMGPVIVYVSLLIPINILIESYLSFLGLGVQEPLTSWGLLISQGASELENAPWLLLFPATLLTVTLFSFNFVGDGLRDAFDPKDR